jgi:hypothetical protein
VSQEVGGLSGTGVSPVNHAQDARATHRWGIFRSSEQNAANYGCLICDFTQYRRGTVVALQHSQGGIPISYFLKKAGGNDEGFDYLF